MHNNDTPPPPDFALWYLGNETTPGTVATHNYLGDLIRIEELSPDEDGDDGLRRLGCRRADDSKWSDDDDLADTYAVEIRPL